MTAGGASRSPHRAGQRRGQPLLVLSGLLLGWISLRAAALSLGVGAPVQDRPTDPAPVPDASFASAPALRQAGSPPLVAPGVAAPAGTTEAHPGQVLLQNPAGLPAPLALPPPPVSSSAVPTRSGQLTGSGWRVSDLLRARPSAQGRAGPRMASFQMVAGHQLLFSAAFAAMPMPLEVAARQARRTPPQPPRRWSLDSWTLWRQGGASPVPLALGASSYGASQAGMVLRYRLADRWSITGYARTSAPLDRPEEAELAAGILARPWRKVPFQTFAEVRADRVGGTQPSRTAIRVRGAAGVISTVGPLRLPLGFRAEPYLQAGYVTGQDATYFADGQVRLDRRIARLAGLDIRAGGGIWGGAQRGAARLDAGPSVAVQFPLGPGQARLSADWRQRVAGKASPDSGLALTLATGF